MLAQGEWWCRADELVRMVRRFRVGEPHRVLRGMDEWVDEDDADTAASRMVERLRAEGLLERDGRPDRDLVDTLAALCHPAYACFGWLTFEGRQRQVLSAQLGREAVLAVREGEDVVFRQLHPERLVAGLLEQLPTANPARFQPIQLSEPAGRTDGEVLVDAGYSRTDEDADTLRKLLQARNYGGAELFVETRDRAGRRSVSENSLGYTVGEYGAWLNLVHRDNHDQPRLFAAPATPEALHRHMGGLNLRC